MNKISFAPITSRTLIINALLVFALLGVSGNASANEEEARAAFRLGKSYFKAGDFQKAAVELKKAYLLKPAPALLKFIGQTYYKMNKARLAIDHFRKYLEEAPKAPDRAAILSRIKELELVVGDEPPEPEADAAEAEESVSGLSVPGEDGATDTQGDAESDAPPAPTTPAAQSHGADEEIPETLAQEIPPDQLQAESTTKEPQKSEGVTALGVTKWATLVGGILAAGGGFVALAMAKKHASDVEEAALNGCPESQPNCGGNPNLDNPKIPYNESHHNSIQSNKSMNAIGIALLAAGGAVTLTSAILFFVDKDESSSSTQAKARKNIALSPTIAPGFYGVSSNIKF